MKSFKKAVLLTLALAMLVSVISLPASAVVDKTGTVSDQGYTDDYEWGAVLKAIPNEASAALTVTLDNHGFTPASITALLDGGGTDNDGNEISLYNETTQYGVKELTISDTKPIKGGGVEIISCSYFVYGNFCRILSI